MGQCGFQLARHCVGPIVRRKTTCFEIIVGTIQCTVALAKFDSLDWIIGWFHELGNECLCLQAGILVLYFCLVRYAWTRLWVQFMVQTDQRESPLSKRAAAGVWAASIFHTLAAVACLQGHLRHF
jgi:hypothetical protein